MTSNASGIRPDVQGLRAIAVLSVVLYHADQRLLPGGFIGVDIFFVISGFLITGILLREAHGGGISITGFYERRVRRLFPALFAMLAVCFLAGAVLLAPDDFSEFARTAVSTVFFYSNIEFYGLTGYFDGASDDKPLLHTWSLAVEEQFYIVFPIMLAVLWRAFSRRLAIVMGGATLLAFAVGVWGAQHHTTAAFYLTPFRAFELAIGATSAVCAGHFRVGPGGRALASFMGGAFLALSLVFIRGGMPFPGAVALAPCLGAAFLILAGAGGPSPVGRMLSIPPLRFFGDISYSLYLWHWPLLAFGRHALMGAPNAWQTALLLMAATILATASWAFLEKPFMRKRGSRPQVFVLAASVMAATAALCVGVISMHGLPGRFPPQAQALFAAAEDYNHARDRCHSDEQRPISYERNCVFGAEGAAPVAAVWGDSAGAELVVALGEVLAQRGQGVMQITSSACAPTLGYQLPERPTCDAHNRDTLRNLLRDDRIQTIVISINFARYPWENRQAVYQGVSRAVEALRGGGKSVVLAYPSPNPWIVVPRVLGLRAARGMPLDSVGVPMETYTADNRANIAFLDALSRRTGAIAFRSVEALCDTTFCPAYRGDVGVLYFNENHISIAGARLALSRFPFAVVPPSRTDVSSR